MCIYIKYSGQEVIRVNTGKGHAGMSCSLTDYVQVATEYYSVHSENEWLHSWPCTHTHTERFVMTFSGTDYHIKRKSNTLRIIIQELTIILRSCIMYNCEQQQQNTTPYPDIKIHIPIDTGLLRIPILYKHRKVST